MRFAKLALISLSPLLLFAGTSRAADTEFSGTVPSSVVINRTTAGKVEGKVGLPDDVLSTEITVKTTSSATLSISSMYSSNTSIPGSYLFRVDVRDSGGQILTSRARDGLGAIVTTGKEASVAVDAAAYTQPNGAPYNVTFTVTNPSGTVAPGVYNAIATIDVTLN